jgi:hypothetical protein
MVTRQAGRVRLATIKVEIEARKRGTAPPEKTDAKGTPESMQAIVKGMQDVGIDAARMRTDAAYAAESKARMMTMSPHEQMAFVQKMMQPQNDVTLRDTRAMADESPAVTAAVEKAKGWNAELSARQTSHGALWNELEQATNRVIAKPFGLSKPAIEYDSPGCDKACEGQTVSLRHRIQGRPRSAGCLRRRGDRCQ